MRGRILSACACLLLASTCGGGGDEAKGNKGEKAPRAEKKGAKAKRGAAKKEKKPPPKPDLAWDRSLRELDGVAEKIGELVRARDVEGLEALWITDEAFDDCHVTQVSLEADGAAKIRAEYSADFRELAARELTEATAGELVLINRRGKKSPVGMGGRFVGDDCNVEHWARVNPIIIPDASPDTPIEHRFNLLMVDGAWKIYRYVPARPDCAGDGRNTLGCKKLRERTESE